MKISVLFLTSFLCFIVFQSCNNTSRNNIVSKKDILLIGVDSSLNVIVNEQKKAFENSYTNLTLSLSNLQEEELIKRLVNNTLNCAVIQRKLTDNEVRYIAEKEGNPPKQYVIAYNALALITNRNSDIQSVSVREAQQYFNNTNPNFNLVFENSKCQAISYFKDRFNLNNEQLSKAYSKNNFQELLNYVGKDLKVIGVIPFSYIADTENPKTIELLKNIKVLNINYQDSAGKLISINPSQESITTKLYPFIMPIVLVNGNLEVKSGTTFVNYILKDRAQRLFLKLGLTPSVFPGREVRVKN